jgi:hypothetical protein
MLALDCGAEFDPAREAEFYAALPARPAVVLIEPRNNAGSSAPDAKRPEPYLLRTADLRKRLERLLRIPAEPTKRLNLREFAARVRYRLTGSAFEQSLVYYQHARAHFPHRCRDLARLRPPALLKVNLANAYPRCYVTRRILADNGAYFGPFPSRKAAENFASEFLNLFKIRRCQIKIRRDPSFPGCIYSEMKMCLAPCFAGCSKEEYDVEVGRVVHFLESAGASHTAELETERAAASEAQDFERAAVAHRKIEKATHVLRGMPEVAQRLEELDAVLLQAAAEENTVAVYAVRGGWIADPFLLNFTELAGQPRSVEQILRERLEPGMNTDEHGSEEQTLTQRNTEGTEDTEKNVGDVEELRDHLSLLARWFYAKPRAGEIFFREARSGPRTRQGDWPYRRILRACSRVLAPQAALPFERPKNLLEPQMNTDKHR